MMTTPSLGEGRSKMAYEPKFTPGPWKVVEHFDGISTEYRIESRCPLDDEEDDNELICSIPGSELSGDNDAANARLIAAAPELFAVAVKACAILDAFRCDGIQPFEDASGLVNDFEKEEIHEALTAAIAKALGK